MRGSRALRFGFVLVLLLSTSLGFAQEAGAELSPAEVRLTAQLDRAFQAQSAPRVRRILERAFRQGPIQQSPVLLHAAERLLTTFTRLEDGEFVVERLPSPSEALQARVVARAHLIGGDLALADALMARWAQRQDRLAAALLREIATAWIQRDALAQAQRSLELARRVLPQDRALLIELASLHLARGLPGPAVALLQSRLQLVTHDDDARRRLALAYHAAGRADDAIGELLRLGEALDLCSASRVALDNDDIPRATALARRALAAAGSPRQEAAGQRALGFALARAGAREPAIRALRRALVLDPSAVEAQTRLEELGEPGS